MCTLRECKAYIPVRRKIFALGIPTCWYLKTRKFVFSPTPNLRFALPPTRNHNASQWNIGCVGSPTQNFRVGHVHFFFWVSISFALVPVFQWNMGLTVAIEHNKSKSWLLHKHNVNTVATERTYVRSVCTVWSVFADSLILLGIVDRG